MAHFKVLNFSIIYLLFIVLKLLPIQLKVFILLTGKTISMYKYAFYSLLDKMNDLNLNFASNTIYADFEQAIHSAVSDIFPDFVRKGCRFHLGQSIWRKIQSLGLSTVFKNKSEVVKFLKLFFGFLFLKPDEINKCFYEDLMAIMANNGSKT